MKAALSVVLSALICGAAGAPAIAAVPVQRFLLVIGANAGGSDRPRLQYAISDAERFARVMVELGGVLPSNEVLLKQPKLKDVIDALDALSARVSDARRASPASRTEIVVYYSGHADEHGLLLGADRYSYRTLRDKLDQIPADVRIAVLDACASGAFTRIKGGKARPAFLVDQSSNMRGHAFLTSSAANESAQESDRIRASYFTHYLTSGFRGAADLSGDGRITLSEAYQFAFTETLGRTVDTRGGAQHPSYDINLSGTGDVVMTDVRQTTATLVIGADLDGRFFVRNSAQELVVELYKPFGRKVELGLEPGQYEVRLDREKSSMLAKTRVDDGATVILDPKQFGAVALEATRRRGPDPRRLAVAGRHRIDLKIGGWQSDEVTVTGVSSMSGAVGLGYTQYLSEALSMSVALTARGGMAGSSTSGLGTFSGAAGLVALPVGMQWNPLAAKNPAAAVKPFVAASVGPYFGNSAGSFAGSGGSFNGAHSQTTIGGHIGGGVDFHLGRPFALGISGGYNWMADFARPVGARDNYSGPQFGVTLGFLFGKGR